jgi:hypothetical protein
MVHLNKSAAVRVYSWFACVSSDAAVGGVPSGPRPTTVTSSASMQVWQRQRFIDYARLGMLSIATHGYIQNEISIRRCAGSSILHRPTVRAAVEERRAWFSGNCALSNCAGRRGVPGLNPCRGRS